MINKSNSVNSAFGSRAVKSGRWLWLQISRHKTHLLAYGDRD